MNLSKTFTHPNPDIKETFTVTVTVNEHGVVLVNGLPVFLHNAPETRSERLAVFHEHVQHIVKCWEQEMQRQHTRTLLANVLIESLKLEGWT